MSITELHWEIENAPDNAIRGILRLAIREAVRRKLFKTEADLRQWIEAELIVQFR